MKKGIVGLIGIFVALDAYTNPDVTFTYRGERFSHEALMAQLYKDIGRNGWGGYNRAKKQYKELAMLKCVGRLNQDVLSAQRNAQVALDLDQHNASYINHQASVLRDKLVLALRDAQQTLDFGPSSTSDQYDLSIKGSFYIIVVNMNYLSLNNHHRGLS